MNVHDVALGILLLLILGGEVHMVLLFSRYLKQLNEDKFTGK
jgi:hypothetical protein